MENEHIAHLLQEHLEGFLNVDQRTKVENHLKTCLSCAKELEEYKMLLGAFGSEMEGKPADSSRERFHIMLEREKGVSGNLLKTGPIKEPNRNNWLPKLLKVAAGLALLVCGYLFGSHHRAVETSAEMAVLREKNLGIREMAMLSLMENRSASKRIQGVNYVENFPRLDQNIIKALTERMLNDENANVRLTAVNALAHLADSKTARKALIQALRSEKNPNIQITVIHTLVKLRDNDAVGPMKRLLDQKDTQPFVKEQIRSLIPSII